eukprot:jgi/Bigna1/140277/aug1.55_g14985
MAAETQSRGAKGRLHTARRTAYILAFQDSMAKTAARDVSKRYAMHWSLVQKWRKKINPLMSMLYEEERREGGLLQCDEPDSSSSGGGGGNSSSMRSAKKQTKKTIKDNNKNKKKRRRHDDAIIESNYQEEDGEKEEEDKEKEEAPPVKKNNGEEREHDHDDDDAKEDDDLNQSVEQEPIPLTLGECKKHPIYAVEHFLTKFQVIRPKGKEHIVGTIISKGKVYHVYRRCNVHTLQSREKWIRSLRQRKGEEEGQQIALFGECIPRSKYGHVEVWTKGHLPLGCLHVDLPRCERIAKKLGIQFAPAMTGFEVKSGRSVPVISGIVVRGEDAEIVKMAWAEVEEDRRRKKQAAEDRMYKRLWRELITNIVVKQKIMLGTDIGYGVEIEVEEKEDEQKDGGGGGGGGGEGRTTSTKMSTKKSRKTTGSKNGKKEKERKKKKEPREPRTSPKEKSLSGIHTHDFPESKYRCIDKAENLWEKTCTICGMKVQWNEL